MDTVVETLSEAIDGAAGEALDTLTDRELDTELVALIRLRHRLDAEIARRACRWEARGVWQSDGSRAPWARLSRAAGVAGGSAKAIMLAARHSSRCP